MGVAGVGKLLADVDEIRGLATEIVDAVVGSGIADGDRDCRGGDSYCDSWSLGSEEAGTGARHTRG